MNLIAVMGMVMTMVGASLFGAHEYWLRKNWPAERADLYAAFYYGLAALAIYLVGVSTHNPNIWGGLGCSVAAHQYGQC